MYSNTVFKDDDAIVAEKWLKTCFPIRESFASITRTQSERQRQTLLLTVNNLKYVRSCALYANFVKDFFNSHVASYCFLLGLAVACKYQDMKTKERAFVP